MQKRIIVSCLFLCCTFMLSAQLTYGTTGLLHTPSAEMQKDKTVMLGANFLNKEITPPTWYYHTYNYYLNVTIMPWLEVAYTCTLFKAEALGLKPYGYTGFTNQDRYFSVRLRALKGTVLEIHAGGCAGNIRPIHILGRCNRFRTGKRILQSFLYCCFQACGYKKRDDRHTPLLFI